MTELLSGKKPRAYKIGEPLKWVMHPPPNAKSSEPYAQRYTPPSSAAQRAQQLKLARLGASMRGRRGTGPGHLNMVALAAITQARGSVGGMTRDQRDRLRYARADATIAKLQAIVGGGPVAPVGPAAPVYPVA